MIISYQHNTILRPTHCFSNNEHVDIANERVKGGGYEMATDNLEWSSTIANFKKKIQKASIFIRKLVFVTSVQRKKKLFTWDFNLLQEEEENIRGCLHARDKAVDIIIKIQWSWTMKYFSI